MSVVMQVFLSDSRMVTPTQWADAIRAIGFDMELNTAFDVHEFTGFLPCRYKGRDAGFEYYYEPAAGLEPLDQRVRDAIVSRDSVVSFVTHSDFRELMTSVIASGVLCSLTDGVLWDTEADDLTPSARALDWAREGERLITQDLKE